ncbi:two-component system, sensor histidine kinase YesM [Cohnella sp. OV330]|uniref:sensor histidine kinase n=1 Tax=Cohnella sp. OV330 TaxID=1855288 RepID=UPI0008E86E46|nr:histidine kinase [Cohnella sp. OV330]SFA82361.1 two-component system, sensor histidine kinase YesM [Cohnella sp. OV330]
MRKIRTYVNSVRFKFFAAVLVIFVPLITVLIINNFYSGEVVRNQVAQSNKNLLSLYMGQIDQRLEEVDKYLSNTLESDLNILDMEFPKSRDEDRYNIAKLTLFNTMKDDIGYYPTLDAFFVYSAVNKDLLISQSLPDGYEERESAREEMTKLVENDADKIDYSRWHVRSGANGDYLFHLMKSGNVYMGAWIGSDKLMVPLNLIDLGESGAAVITTGENKPISHGALFEDKGIDLTFPDESYAISGKGKHAYLIMGERSRLGNFNLVALVPENEILQKLPYLQRVSSIISITAVMFLLLFLAMMRSIFLNPVKRIVIAMRKLRDGNWDSRLDQKPTSTEFQIVNETFNRMIGEIHDLKINVYEEKLNHQRAELKHLQLQINPHFFLNSLNIIYNLATVKDFSLIQEMTKCLVSYFRFMFRSSSYFVPLGDELSHTSNYLRIQQLRFPDLLHYSVEKPDDLLAQEVPPLIVQTMVENAIKYAVNMDEPIRISVEVAQAEDEEGNPRLVIHIKDTGPGFPDEVLGRLALDPEQAGSEGGEQIGIWNARRRLRLLYQDRATIDFYNGAGLGAVVKIEMPMQKKAG